MMSWATSFLGTVRPTVLRKVLASGRCAMIISWMNVLSSQTVGLLYIKTFVGIATV